jgi:hypothetical protein
MFDSERQAMKCIFCGKKLKDKKHFFIPADFPLNGKKFYHCRIHSFDIGVRIVFIRQMVAMSGKHKVVLNEREIP